MIEQRCGTCKHWNQPGVKVEEFTPTDSGGVFGVCSKIDRADHQYHRVYPCKEAWVADHEEFSAALLCKPTFGCVLHEPRRTPADQPASD